MARVSHSIDPAAITLDTPLRLAKAADLAFPEGSIQPSTMSAEARRGNLVIWPIAGKQYTTLRAIEEMNERCRDTQRGPGSTSPVRAGATASSTSASRGSFETKKIRSARASLQLTAQRLSASV